jgi:cytoskeletal protein CcmA (bactofilin family)
MSFWNKLREEASPLAAGEETMPVSAPPITPLRNEEPSSMAMLKREDLTTTVSGSGDLNALLGRGSEFDGKLTFEGTVRIDGKFTGTIVTNDVLVVGEGAKINAEINCGTVVVHGEITGNVKAKNAVELHHPAKVRGNIEAPSLMIEKGVMFEGQAKMEGVAPGSSKPASLTPSPISAVKT